MPIYKYRRIEDMPSERWLEPGDPAIVRRMRLVWRMASALAGPLAFPRGVRKYHSVEEMNAEREAWEDERINRIRERSTNR
jgi:hypothetical protein